MSIIHPQTGSGKRNGYVTFYDGDNRPEEPVATLRDVRRIARKRSELAILVHHFDDVCGGWIFRSPSDAMRYRLGLAAANGDAADFFGCDTEKHAPLGCFFVSDQFGDGCRR